MYFAARHWLTDKLFELLPETAHLAVDPGFFAGNYLNLVPMAAQLGVLPVPTGGAAMRHAPTKTSPALRSVRCLTHTATTGGPTDRPGRRC